MVLFEEGEFLLQAFQLQRQVLLGQFEIVQQPLHPGDVTFHRVTHHQLVLEPH